MAQEATPKTSQWLKWDPVSNRRDDSLITTKEYSKHTASRPIHRQKPLPFWRIPVVNVKEQRKRVANQEPPGAAVSECPWGS